jgi:hypothetical protein
MMKKTRVAASIAVSAMLLIGAGQALADSHEVNDRLVNKEQKLWKAWQDKDAEAFRKNLWPDAVLISGSGMENYTDVLENFGEECEVRGFSLSDYAFRKMSDNVVLLTYMASQDATCNGRELPSPVRASSIYVQRDGEWKNIFYQESAVQ